MTDAKRLAKAARELAMECAAGTAPKFGVGAYFHDTMYGKRPCCAAGHVVARAGGAEIPGGALPLLVSEILVSEANDEASVADRNDSVIFPLLAWADELEALS